LQFQTKIPLPAQVLVDAHWNDIDNVKDYNDNIKFSRCLTKLTDNVDVANYASNEKFMVSSREFLVGRMRINFGNGYILAGRSCEIDGFKSSKNTVRFVLIKCHERVLKGCEMQKILEQMRGKKLASEHRIWLAF
ncbi:hypothetical protein OESDEN_22463, partial [Oesophagostomum dentatum]